MVAVIIILINSSVGFRFGVAVFKHLLGVNFLIVDRIVVVLIICHGCSLLCSMLGNCERSAVTFFFHCIRTAVLQKPIQPKTVNPRMWAGLGTGTADCKILTGVEGMGP